jgi:hypothetical protein
MEVLYPKGSTGSAVSGKSKTDAVQYVSRKSQRSLAGTATTEKGGQKVVQTRQQTECSFIPPVISKYTARVYTWRNRALQRALKRLELLDAKVSRAVLRGRDGGNTILLPDTDVKDSGLAELLRHGLLKASFLPLQPIRDLREVVRYRKTLVYERTQEISRLQKVLETANSKLASVVSDVLGKSGREMLAYLVEGVNFS